MKYGKFSTRHKTVRGRKRSAAVALSLLLLLTLTIGGTLAYLTSSTANLVNTFLPSEVKITVTEEFDGEYKKNINVSTEGSDIDTFVRVKLISYRVNADGNHIGGTSAVLDFELGKDWFEKDGYYYYSKSVAPNSSPATNLATSIQLVEYDDVDGGKQVIEVMAEAIQAKGVNSQDEAPAKLAWGVDVNADGTQISK